MGMSATAAGCGFSVGMNLKGVEIMNRVIFYKTATCPSCGKVVTFATNEKRGTVCRCMGAEKAMEPGNKVKAIIVKEVTR